MCYQTKILVVLTVALVFPLGASAAENRDAHQGPVADVGKAAAALPAKPPTPARAARSS